MGIVVVVVLLCCRVIVMVRMLMVWVVLIMLMVLVSWDQDTLLHPCNYDHLEVGMVFCVVVVVNRGLTVAYDLIPVFYGTMIVVEMISVV